MYILFFIYLFIYIFIYLFFPILLSYRILSCPISYPNLSYLPYSIFLIILSILIFLSILSVLSYRFLSVYATLLESLQKKQTIQHIAYNMCV